MQRNQRLQSMGGPLRTSLLLFHGGNTGSIPADFEKLAGAVAAGGGSGNVAFIASPRQAISASLRLGGDRAQVVWSSPALAAGTVIAIDPTAFASAFGPDPRIDASIETTVHMEDASPAQIGTAGSPNVVAAPALSAYQQDLVVIKCRLDVAWAMRQSGLVAVINSATWG